MGFGPFSSSSETKLKAFEFGNIAASEGGQNVVIAGSAQGAVLPGGTLYKAKNINLSVTSTGTSDATSCAKSAGNTPRGQSRQLSMCARAR